MTEENKKQVKSALVVFGKEVFRAFVTFGSVVIALLIGN